MVRLFLKPNAKPVFCSKRPVPFNTILLVDAELTRLQSLGIITPVDFSEWAAPIVAVRKPNGRVRICADYSTGLNEVLEANHYPLPTPEEIFAQLNGSCVFSIKHQRLQEYGFHVKMEKCRFFQNKIRYLGHIVDRHGIRPDPEKLQSIASIPPPTNVSELRSFLGAVNFYGRFVRNIHEFRLPAVVRKI